MHSPFRAVLAAGFVLLAGCNDPHDMLVPRDANGIDAKTQERLKALPEGEREMVARYMIRHLLGNNGSIPQGTTVAAAIAEQRDFEKMAAQREKDAAEIKASVERERAAARGKLLAAVSVVLVEKDFEPEDIHNGRYHAQTGFKVAYANTSGKAIAGVKGALVFRDLFGDDIKRLGIAMTDAIEPGKTVVWDGSVDVNQFSREDKELAFTPLEKMKVEFEPMMVVFADGSELTAP